MKLSVRFIGSFWSFIRRRTDVWTGNCYMTYIEWRIDIIYTSQSCELLDLNFWLRNRINLPTLCLIWQTRFLKADGNSFQDVIKTFSQKSIPGIPDIRDAVRSLIFVFGLICIWFLSVTIPFANSQTERLSPWSCGTLARKIKMSVNDPTKVFDQLIY